MVMEDRENQMLKRLGKQDLIKLFEDLEREMENTEILNRRLDAENRRLDEENQVLSSRVEQLRKECKDYRRKMWREEGSIGDVAAGNTANAALDMNSIREIQEALELANKNAKQYKAEMQQVEAKKRQAVYGATDALLLDAQKVLNQARDNAIQIVRKTEEACTSLFNELNSELQKNFEQIKTELDHIWNVPEEDRAVQQPMRYDNVPVPGNYSREAQENAYPHPQQPVRKEEYPAYPQYVNPYQQQYPQQQIPVAYQQPGRISTPQAEAGRNYPDHPAYQPTRQQRHMAQVGETAPYASGELSQDLEKDFSNMLEKLNHLRDEISKLDGGNGYPERQ